MSKLANELSGVFSHARGMAVGSAVPIGLPLQSGLKYLNNYMMDWQEVLFKNSWSAEDETY